ncbi:hypothetical protein, partial [Paenibacillus marchantiophytorum]|uniref:hypothetical protein n=1 Tax=Paenibacillus marchantiophytorum TaxID=1619310 RepID=UPI001E5465BA
MEFLLLFGRAFGGWLLRLAGFTPVKLSISPLKTENTGVIPVEFGFVGSGKAFFCISLDKLQS